MDEYKFTYLSESDIKETLCLSASNCNRVIEEALGLVAKGDFLMGGSGGCEHGIQLCFPEASPIPGIPLNAPDYRYMAMVGYLGGGCGLCGTKVYGSNPDNSRIGLPRSNHVIILNNVKTGLPVAILNGTGISGMRTGAIAGVGAKYLAPEGAKTLGLVGAGWIGRTAAMCIADALPALETIYLYDRCPEKSRAFAESMKELPARMVCADSPGEMLPRCDILHYATSAVPPLPYIEPALVKAGALVIISCIVDFPAQLLEGANIVVDYLKMHEVWYKDAPQMNLATYRVLERIQRGQMAREDVGELGSIVLGGRRYRGGGRTTLFMDNGMSAWDIALASSVYRKAREMGLGTQLSL